MPHDISLITTIAAALGFGLIFGFIAARLKLPALVGYLAAGIIIGPATPGFVADAEIAGQLSEIGVMLMMFGVGLHFSFENFWDVRKIALPGAILQIGVATAIGVLAAVYVMNDDRGVPLAVVIMLLLMVFFTFLTERTRFGRHIFAVGGNLEASKRAGIRTDGVKIAVFTMASPIGWPSW